MKMLCIRILIGLVTITSFVSAEIKQHIRVDLHDRSDAVAREFIRMHPDITAIDRLRESVDVVVTASDVEAIKRLGLPVEILIEDVDAYTRGLLQDGYFDHFHNYDRMLAEIQAVEAAHPDIVRVYDIGDGWDKINGRADRDIWAVKISDNVDTEEPDEPEVLYIACHHAREIITPEVLLYFLNYLADGYGTDPEVTYLVNNRQLWLVPIMNPDGHAAVFTGTDCRKNTRDNDENGVFNHDQDGVDLNRNWGYMWGYDDDGSGPNPDSELYRGPEAFSEPETRAVRDLALAHDFKISLSYHSIGGLYVYSWQYTRVNTPDHDTFVHLADRYVAFNGYEHWPQWEWYPINGGSEDWLYGERGILAFTVEVGTSADFYPDTSEVMDLILENLGPNLYAAWAAGRYITYNTFNFDEVAGDGDGVIDPGETITLTVRLHNGGLEGTAELTGILSTSDPDITVDDGEGIYPGMAFGATVENIDDPFTITVDSDVEFHIVVFILTLWSAGQQYCEVVTFNLLLGQDRVLLVADDGYIDNQSCYIDVFNHLNIPYRMEEIQGPTGSIPAGALGCGEVIWFTGTSLSNTLTAGDRDALASFLDGGGRLLLSGSFIGSNIRETDFYQEYLYADYVTSRTRLHHLNSTPLNPVVPDMSITLASSGPTAQDNAGETDPVSPAISIFDYDRTTAEGPGIISSSGSGALAVEVDGYKVAYFSFGLEGVESLQQRADIITGVLSWFKDDGSSGGGDGDVDGNGLVNVIDVVIGVNIILGIVDPTPDQLCAADVTGDGTVNILDIIGIVNLILGSSPVGR